MRLSTPFPMSISDLVSQMLRALTTFQAGIRRLPPRIWWSIKISGRSLPQLTKR